MLKTRLITAAILSAMVIYILSFSPEYLFHFIFTAVIILIIFFCGTEFSAMRWNVMESSTKLTQSYPTLKLKHFAIGFAYSLAVLIFIISKSLFTDEPEKILVLPVAWIFLCLFISAVLIYRRAIDMHTASNKLLNVIAGFVYLSLPALCIIQLSYIHFAGSHRNGHLYFFLATVFMGDGGAYFIGSKYGKHKLAPRISPKKSLEGSLGGLGVSLLAAVIFSYFFKLPFPIWYSILVALCVGISAQIGDLMESAFKRAGGYKDSGNLLPGHGGFLDRVDSLILSIPVIFVFFLFYA